MARDGNFVRGTAYGSVPLVTIAEGEPTVMEEGTSRDKASNRVGNAVSQAKGEVVGCLTCDCSQNQTHYNITLWVLILLVTGAFGHALYWQITDPKDEEN